VSLLVRLLCDCAVFNSNVKSLYFNPVLSYTITCNKARICRAFIHIPNFRDSPSIPNWPGLGITPSDIKTSIRRELELDAMRVTIMCIRPIHRAMGRIFSSSRFAAI